MKKLLLASSGTFITRFNVESFDKPIRDMKMAYITTASKKVDDVSYIEIRKREMSEQGFDYEEIDITGKNKNELKKILENKECIFVEGGNTFYLLKQVRKSGFEEVVKELIKQGVIYIGSSAGTYLACPTIEISVKASRHDFDKCGIVDYTAMNLVPFLIKVHHTVGEEDVLKEKLKDVNHSVRLLKDNQAFLVEDDDVTLLGS